MENNSAPLIRVATDIQNAPKRNYNDFWLGLGCLVGWCATLSAGYCAASAVCLALWFGLELSPIDK